MREAVITIAALAVLMIGAQAVFRRRRRSFVPERIPWTGGPVTIRPPRRNAVMFGITALVPAGLLGGLTVWSWSGSAGAPGRLASVVATLAVAAFAAYQFAYAARARLVVHDTGIERIGVSQRRHVGWGSIAKIAFNPAHHWFFVTAADGSHLWLPADVSGMSEFAQIAVRRLPPAVLQADPMAREVLDELAGVGADEKPREAR